MVSVASYLKDRLVGNDPWNSGNVIGYRADDGSLVYYDEYSVTPSLVTGLFADGRLVGPEIGTNTFENGNILLRISNVSGSYDTDGRPSYWLSTGDDAFTLVVSARREEFLFGSEYTSDTFIGFLVENDPNDTYTLYTIDQDGGLHSIIGGSDARYGDWQAREDSLQFSLDAEGISFDTYVTDGKALWRLNEVDEAPTALTIDRSRTPESAQAGFVVARFAVQDPDVRDRSFYHIVSDSTGGALAIVDDALIVSTGMRFDFETDPQIAVTIRAVDLAGNTIFRSFSLDVLNVDTNRPPVITSNGGGATAALSIGERALTVTQVGASDPDDGTEFAFAIVGGADAALLRIDAATGVLSFRSQTDFETPVDADRDNVYDVTVSASDGVFDVSQRMSITVLHRPDGGEQVIAATGAVIFSSNGTANGSAAADTIIGSVRADNIYGKSGDDTISGGDGNDSVRGDSGADVLFGEAGNDLLDGGAGLDRMAGGPGDDLYIVDQTGDQMLELAGQGRDTVRASVSWVLGAEIEALELTGGSHLTGQGNALDNKLRGNAGDNLLFGGGGRDAIDGGEGWDVLVGGVGADQLTGGAGADRFRFDQVTTAGERDIITDFARGVDRIEIVATVFGLSAGALNPALFSIGAAPATTATRFVYNPQSGVLSYDPDGNGSTAMIQLALLTGAPALSASDFTII